MVSRRNFLRSLVGGVAGAAAVLTFPFRVFSFPSKPIIPLGRIDFLDMSEWGKLFISSVDLEGVALKQKMLYDALRDTSANLTGFYPTLYGQNQAPRRNSS